LTLLHFLSVWRSGITGGLVFAGGIITKGSNCVPAIIPATLQDCFGPVGNNPQYTAVTCWIYISEYSPLVFWIRHFSLTGVLALPVCTYTASFSNPADGYSPVQWHIHIFRKAHYSGTGILPAFPHTDSATVCLKEIIFLNK
jgi:hypothetical protein